jgi:hypothetical protein
MGRSALCSYWCATRWEREPKKKKNEEILVRIGSGSKIDREMNMSFFVRREADHISNDNNTRTTRWKIKYGRWIRGSTNTSALNVHQHHTNTSTNRPRALTLGMRAYQFLTSGSASSLLLMKMGAIIFFRL